MKHSSHLMIGHASGMALLLIIPVLLTLLQPTTSQVYVNSSSNNANIRTSAPKRTTQSQVSMVSFQTTASTEDPFKGDNTEVSPGAKTENVLDKNASAKGDPGSNQPPQPLNNTVLETSTYHSKRAELTAQVLSPNVTSQDGLAHTQQSPTRTLTTVNDPKIGGHSEKRTADVLPTKQHKDRNTTMSERTNKITSNESNGEDSPMSAMPPTEVSSQTGGSKQEQTANIQTIVSKAHLYSTTEPAFQPKPSSTTPVKKPTSTLVSSQVFEDKTITSGPHVEVAGESKERSQPLSSSPSPVGSTFFYPSVTNQLRTLAPKEISSSTTQPAQAKTTHNQQAKDSGSRETSTTIQQRPEKQTSKSLSHSGTTEQKTLTDTTTSQSTTRPLLMGRLLPLDNNVEKDHSSSLGNLPTAKPSPTPLTTQLTMNPCVMDLGVCASPKDPNTLSAASNRTLLVWADLSRTLSFAWELHVFGSAALFLLLTAGSALGLALAPGMHCPHCGALALANGFLLLAGAIRATYFLLDPYGSRLILPLPAMTAMYTMAQPLLIWAQTALVVLVLKGAEVVLLHPSLQHPPLLALLAVLQCTLLLAVDLLSSALSPAVPIVLQTLSLTSGLVLCLGYLCLVLPRLSDLERGCARDKGVSKLKLKVLVRVLALCALLGALCCLLHAYACLWLYGLLGNWQHFRWTWWLIQFWARLLELAWAFCLLLLASWVFWRPRGGQIGRGEGQGVGTTGDLASPCPSSDSSTTHTCWAKIVQSLKGRPYLKSDSNGVGGANGSSVAGERPNNWVGQERPGADITKSLIRNRDPPKESNRGRNQRSIDASSGSLARLQALGQQWQSSLSGSLDREKESAISLYDFDLRPPTPIDLSRSIDEALHREHLLRGGSLFRPLGSPSPPPSPGNQLRRNSDPQIMLSDSSDDHTLTESSAGLDRPIPSAVPSRQVTAPPTPTHQGPRWICEATVPSSISCPVSLHPSPSFGNALTPSTEDTRPFLTPDLAGLPLAGGGERGYVKVSRHDDSGSVSSDIIDL